MKKKILYAFCMIISVMLLFNTFIYASTNDKSNNAKKIALGRIHSMVIRNDGKVFSWGGSDLGQLGIDGIRKYEDIKTPSVINSLENVKMIASKGSDCAALKYDGTVWVWGGSQLGDGTRRINNPITKPTKVENVSNIVDISVGGVSLYVLKNDGTVWSWGYNMQGQLGNGTTNDSFKPGKIKGLSNIVSISAGNYHVAALDSKGNVWTWGYNQYGQLGNGTILNSEVPTKVNGLSDVIAISSGGNHTLVLKKDGTVWETGIRIISDLEDETKYSVIFKKVDGLNNIISIAAGDNHSLALKDDGTVWAWGTNSYGCIGDGTKESKENPVIIKNLSDIVSIDAGYFHSLAIKKDGTIWTWGSNQFGQLGNGLDGLESNSLSPEQILDTNTLIYKNQIVLEINNPKMNVNGTEYEIDPGKSTAPTYIKGKTCLPIRALIEKMGGTVDWQGSESKITINYNSKKIELWINSLNTKVNGEEKAIEVAPQAINGKTMIPLRYIIENLGLNLIWDSQTQQIIIQY